MPGQAHVLVTFGGTFSTGSDAEIWQCGVKMGAVQGTTASPLTLLDLTAYVNSIQAAVSTWFSSAANMMRNDFTLNWVKAANISGGDDTHPYGKYLGATDSNGGPNPALYQYATPVAGGFAISSGQVPQIITLALTWRNAAAPKGPRHSASHGRIYPPFALGTPTDRVSGSLTNWVNSGKALLTALSKPGGWTIGGQAADLKPVLVGKDGTLRPIDQVAIGNVVDTVRNRKSKLREVYTTSAWS